MALTLEAVNRCEGYDLDPKIGFKAQYLIAPVGMCQVPGMKEIKINKWSVLHGTGLKPVALKDDKDRVYGVFFGTGVDGKGELVSATSFASFNSKGRTFESDFEAYLETIGGRYILVLDTGSKTRVYRDPMGHMPIFYNNPKGLAGSSIHLVLDRSVSGNPICAQPGEDLSSTSAVFPVGQTADKDVRLLPGNHVLELSDVSAHRGWPLRNTIRKVSTSKSAPVVEKIAARLREIVQGWIRSDDVVLPLDGSAGSRIILAAAGELRSQIAQVCVLQSGGFDDVGTAAIAAEVANTADVKLEILNRQAAFKAFGHARTLRHERKRFFWLRTSSAIRVPSAVAINLTGLQPAQHLVLSADGLEALQGGWKPGKPDPKPIRSSQIAELSGAVGVQRAEKDVRDGVIGDYEAWKESLPKTLHDQTEDFIRTELHEPSRAVATLGYADHVPASPFSDRTVIELALKLPLSFRSGEAFAEALISELDPSLEGLPYIGSYVQTDAAE